MAEDSATDDYRLARLDETKEHETATIFWYVIVITSSKAGDWDLNGWRQDLIESCQIYNISYQMLLPHGKICQGPKGSEKQQLAKKLKTLAWGRLVLSLLELCQGTPLTGGPRQAWESLFCQRRDSRSGWHESFFWTWHIFRCVWKKSNDALHMEVTRVLECFGIWVWLGSEIWHQSPDVK